MKKVVTLIITFIMLLGVSATAEEITTPEDNTAAVAEQNAQLLEDIIPSEAGEILAQNGFSDLSADSILNMKPDQVFSYLWNQLKNQARAPFVMLLTVFGAMILCALAMGMGNSFFDTQLAGVFSTVSVLCIAATIITPILSCVIKASQAIESSNQFLKSYIPVYAGLMMANGQVATGTSYNIVMFAAVQIVSQIVSASLIPLLGIYLALAIISAMNPSLNLMSTANMIKSFAVWGLSFVFTIFVAILTIQGIVGNSADTVAIRTGKFFVGSFVPVVGAALSEAAGTLQSCVKLLKNTMGAYGIIIAVISFVPTLIEILLFKLICNIGAAAGDLLAVGKVSEILKAISQVLSMLLGVILCFAMLIIVSTTIMMMLGLGI